MIIDEPAAMKRFDIPLFSASLMKIQIQDSSDKKMGTTKWLS